MHHLLCPHCWAAAAIFIAMSIPILKAYVPGWKKKLKAKTEEHADACTSDACTHHEHEDDHDH